MRLAITEDFSIPWGELRFKTSRSRGPGGQNVNKVESRVTLEFDVLGSPSLTDEQKTAIIEHLGPRVNRKGILRIVSEGSRSQWLNKEDTLFRFVSLLSAALKPRKERVATKPTRSSKKERVDSKKIHGKKKQLRRSDSGDE